MHWNICHLLFSYITLSQEENGQSFMELELKICLQDKIKELM